MSGIIKDMNKNRYLGCTKGANRGGGGQLDACDVDETYQNAVKDVIEIHMRGM